MKTRLLSALLLLVLLPARTLAQEAKVTSMTETTDFIAGDDQRRDYNKKLCALVKVQVVDEITDVEGNVMGDIVNHGVEKWVYMAEGSRNMKIHLKNNLPVKVMFRDYDIDGLKSNRVYVVVLNVPNRGNVDTPSTATTQTGGGGVGQPVTTTGGQPLPGGVTQPVQGTGGSLYGSSQPAVTFTVTAGLNMATAQFGGNYDGSTGSVVGLHLGVTADLRLADTFFFTTGLLYSGKGYTTEGKPDIDEKASPAFVDVPLLAKLRLPLGQQAGVQLSAGPYLGLCVGGKVTDQSSRSSYDESFSSAYSGFDFGLQAGVGFDFATHFVVGASYQAGMGSSYSNRNLMISLGYRF